MTVAPRLQPREATAPQLVNVLHSPKRVRVKFGGRTIADSRNVLVLRSNLSCRSISSRRQRSTRRC